MKRNSFSNMKRALLLVGTALTLFALTGVAGAAKDGRKIATVDIAPAPELFATEPQPLTVTQCGQCHPGIFKNLKNDGARHRFDCQKCHATFHAYNPKKGGWEAIMPKCGSCHAEPHGKSITDCANCHTNPHTPKKVAMEARLLNACGDCHTTPKEQLAAFPSKHSKLGCNRCHTSHGFKPTCFACHKPHHEGQEIATCTKCHQVHKPKVVTYGKDAPAATCGACHGKIYGKWQKTASKHGKVNCATCHHDKHGYVPKCTECHGLPHKESIHQHFPNCLSCHLDVHDLPAKGQLGSK
jgi:hypothetical protein